MPTEKTDSAVRADSASRRTAPGVFSSNALKIIACLSMLTDHIGAVLFPQVKFLRIIGRIAMPIYCFLLTEGAYRTHNPKKYIGRMVFFAFLSEIPFDLAFAGKWFFPGYQNVMITLTLGLFCLFGLDWLKKKLPRGKWIPPFLLLTGALCAAAVFLDCDYGFLGILMVLSCRLLRRDKRLGALALAVVCTAGHMLQHRSGTLTTEVFALFALPLLFLYSGEKGKGGKPLQYGFYAFYPAHLLILGILRCLL